MLWLHDSVLKARARGWGIRAMWLLARPSWLRYRYRDFPSLKLIEHGTLRLGFAQVKWTRTIAETTDAR